MIRVAAHCAGNSIWINHSTLLHIVITALLIFQAGCGATQLGMCAPHTKEEGAPTWNWAECFDRPFSHGNMTHSVFCLNGGTDKPPVLLLHELTGLSPGTLAYAEELSRYFTVYVPLLFGEKGKFSLTKGLSAYWFQGSLEFFPGGEWGVPSQGSAPIVNWLRGVVQKIAERHGQQHIGIVGNCLTGPIPLALLNHPRVNAGVVAQPALPLRFWWYADADKKSLGLSTDDLQYARKSAARIYGLRFQTDCMSDPTKQDTLRDEFGDRYINGEIPVTAYQVEGKPVKAHSTLIGSWREHGEAGQPSRDARERVREFLLKELIGPAPRG
jgi:dienelactone hydrolase